VRVRMITRAAAGMLCASPGIGNCCCLPSDTGKGQYRLGESRIQLLLDRMDQPRTAGCEAQRYDAADKGSAGCLPASPRAANSQRTLLPSSAKKVHCRSTAMIRGSGSLLPETRRALQLLS